MTSGGGSSAAVPPSDLAGLCEVFVEQAPLAMAVLTGDNYEIRHANPAFCRLQGRPRDELVGQSFCDLLPQHHPCRDLIARVHRTGESGSHTEEHPSADRPASLNFTVWRVPGDAGPAVIMVQVAESTALQERMRAMNEALILGSVHQHELAAAADALTAQVQEADHRKTEFLALLAHELRNPLAPIRYMLEVMRRAEGKAELLVPALGVIDRQVQQLTRLIDDLLDVARISREKLQLRLEEVELGSIMRQVVEIAGPGCEAAGLELTLTLPRQPLHLRADPARLTQLFGNLVHNACKFTNPGGRVSLSARRAGSDAVVTVTDTGVGIRPELLPKVFEMFVQGDHTLERTQGGLGIGLTLVQQLVQMHGGSIEAFSEGENRGSKFVVRLPALASKTPPADSAVAPNHRLTGHRVLVVDDNRDAANSLALLLQLTGNETELAFDGLAALAVGEHFRPDVILMDIGMPNLNGYEAARLLRQQPWGKRIALIALTGWGRDDDRRKAADAGFDAHVTKPVEYRTLAKLLGDLTVTADGR